MAHHFILMHYLQQLLENLRHVWVIRQIRQLEAASRLYGLILFKV